MRELRRNILPIRIIPPKPQRKNIGAKENRPIKVLYDDDYYAAFDKPAGLLVIPSPQKEKHTLLSFVNAPLAASSQGWRLHPCHRLDRDTSGVTLFAKGKKNQKIMMEAFRQKKVWKIYIAFVHGRLKNPSGEIKSSIKDFEQSRFGRRSVARWACPPLSWKGRRALTRYRVIETKKDFSILQVTPVTGQTNQIRIHFSQLGHPLVGERKYAFGKDYALKFRRTALHASSLSFIHPVFKREIRIHSPLPEDMKQFRLRNP